MRAAKGSFFIVASFKGLQLLCLVGLALSRTFGGHRFPKAASSMFWLTLSFSFFVTVTSLVANSIEAKASAGHVVHLYSNETAVKMGRAQLDEAYKQVYNHFEKRSC